MRIENRVYSTPPSAGPFRKLHLEVALRSDGLAVLHGVAFPWVTVDLPILAFDLVAMMAGGRGGVRQAGGAAAQTTTPAPAPLSLAPVSLAIIDPCPVSDDRSLPPPYAAAVAALQAAMPGGATSNRATPDWGSAIFSDACVLARPGADAGAAAAFGAYAAALNALHLEYAAGLLVTGKGGNAPSASIQAAHGRWADHQLRNDRTRRVLVVAFGEEWADRYMRTVMFVVERAGVEAA